MLAILLSSNYAVKELAAIAILHDYVHVAVVDVTFVKLYNIRVVNLL